MKKLVCVLILIPVLFLLSACEIGNGAGSQPIESGSRAHVETNNEDQSVTGDANNADIEIETQTSDMQPSDKHPSDILIPDGMVIYSACYDYYTFYEIIQYATDVIRAKFVGVTFEQDGCIHYEFEVVESYRGLGLEETIIVDELAIDGCVIVSGLSFSTYDIRYKVGNDYLLFLTRRVDDFSGEYSLNTVSDILVVAVNENGKACLSSGESMYYGEDLSMHIGSDEIAKAFENESLEEYVVDLIKDNPMFEGREYIDSEDVSEILKASDFVIEIEIIEEHPIKNETGLRDNFICELVAIYKGEREKTDLTVIFPAGTVEIGKRYIVAARRVSDTMVILTNKHSVYTIEQREEICSMLAE